MNKESQFAATLVLETLVLGEAVFVLKTSRMFLRCNRLKFLTRRWGELFGVKFDVLPYDLTSTYFETDTERSPEDLRQYGYSRD